MFEKTLLLPVVKLYRRSMLLQALMILLVVVDLMAMFFAPVWVLALFLVAHIALFIYWIHVKTQLMNELLAYLVG